MTTEPKPLPKLKTDKEAEDFVENADLTEFDMSEFKPVRFEMKPMPDLLPCPFCGGEASITDCELHSHAYEIGCRQNAECPLSPEIWDTNYDRGVKRWNTRAEPVNRQMLDVLKSGNWTYLGGERVVCIKTDVVNNAITAAEQCQQDTVAIPRDVLARAIMLVETAWMEEEPLPCEETGIALLKPYVKGGD
jgi:hypothetical protein